MTRLFIGRYGYDKLPLQQVYDIYRLRHEVFHDELEWEVNSVSGMECDHFDALTPLYIYAENLSNHVEGCWRALPTSGPNMLRDTFPQLLRGECMPEDEHIWELSRFAISKSCRGRFQTGLLNPVALQMMEGAVRYALEHNIHHYVTVTTVAVERLMKQVIPLRRFGDGKAVKLGRVSSTAVWFDVTEENLIAIEAALQHQSIAVA